MVVSGKVVNRNRMLKLGWSSVDVARSVENGRFGSGDFFVEVRVLVLESKEELLASGAVIHIV